MKTTITVLDHDLIIAAALRWNIASGQGSPANTRQYLRANWHHPQIIQKHWLYLRDLAEESDFWQRVDGQNRQTWRDYRETLATMPELPRHRQNRKLRTRGIGLLTVDALHYTLGRTSYMPGVLMEHLRANWHHPELQQQRETILTTIAHWLNHETTATYAYQPAWQTLHHQLKTQP